MLMPSRMSEAYLILIFVTFCMIFLIFLLSFLSPSVLTAHYITEIWNELLYMLQGGLNFYAKCYVENVVLQITSTICLTLKKIVSLESLVYLYPQDDYRLALILAQ